MSLSKRENQLSPLDSYLILLLWEYINNDISGEGLEKILPYQTNFPDLGNSAGQLAACYFIDPFSVRAALFVIQDIVAWLFRQTRREYLPSTYCFATEVSNFHHHVWTRHKVVELRV